MSNIRHCVVVANGELTWPERVLPIIRSAELLIAADGGANALARSAVYPQVLVGDMDSVEPDILTACERQGCRLRRFPAGKDETDTELALLEAVRLGAEQITLLGAVGGRIDHTLANLLLLALPELANRRAALFTGSSFITLVREYAEVEGSLGDLLSLIPLAGDALGVCTAGLEYPLRNEALRFGPARGISNVLLAGKAQVWLSSGLLWMVHTPREWQDA